MKRIFSITLIATLTVFMLSLIDLSDANKLAESDKYNVITVQGKIIFKSSGEEMKRGDIYISGTRLNFLSNNSRAAIVNKSKGRFVLTGSSKGKIKVLPAVNNMSSRSGALLNVVDLKKHFNERYLVLKRSEIQIGSAAFPMDKDNFFYLTYDHNGEEIAKKLRHEGDFLILDKDEIYKVDGEPIPYTEKEMTLYYRQNEKGTKINSFTPVFADVDVLKEEINLLLSTLDDISNEEKIKEVTSYLIEFYGNPYKNNLNAWLKAEFDLE